LIIDEELICSDFNPFNSQKPIFHRALGVPAVNEAVVHFFDTNLAFLRVAFIVELYESGTRENCP
jgi:hypothetical protein